MSSWLNKFCFIFVFQSVGALLGFICLWWVGEFLTLFLLILEINLGSFYTVLGVLQAYMVFYIFCISLVVFILLGCQGFNMFCCFVCSPIFMFIQVFVGFLDFSSFFVIWFQLLVVKFFY